LRLMVAQNPSSTEPNPKPSENNLVAAIDLNRHDGSGEPPLPKKPQNNRKKEGWRPRQKRRVTASIRPPLQAAGSHLD
jgi:hypothetical protein